MQISFISKLTLLKADPAGMKGKKGKTFRKMWWDYGSFIFFFLYFLGFNFSITEYFVRKKNPYFKN